MKKLTLLTLLLAGSFSIFAQPVNTLDESFDAGCSASGVVPSGWRVFTPTTATIPEGEWGCSTALGRPTNTGAPTPGMQCTGTYSGVYHLDTSYLLTPVLAIGSSFSGGHAYLLFDTRKEDIILGGKLAVVATGDTSLQAPFLSLTITPALSNADSANWVTHQIDLTTYIDTPMFYVAFRYTSGTTSGTAWYLDNVRLSRFKLNVPGVNNEVMPLTVIGNSTSSQVKLSYSTPHAGNYNIAIYDMVGRIVYNGKVNAQEGTADHTITGLDLHSGMYCIKMGNEDTYGTTKLLIQ